MVIDPHTHPRGQSRPHKRMRPIEPLSTEEVNRLLASCHGGSTGLRGRALIVVLWRAGLRVGEALALLPKDFVPPEDLGKENGAIRVRSGKTGERVVPLDPAACAVVARWLDRRATFPVRPSDPLFCTVSSLPRDDAKMRYERNLPGGPLSTASVRRLLARLGQKAGIEKRVHPHGLRHSFAQDLALEGKSVLLIQAALGHSNVATTYEYLHGLMPMALLDGLGDRPAWTDE